MSRFTEESRDRRTEDGWINPHNLIHHRSRMREETRNGIVVEPGNRT